MKAALVEAVFLGRHQNSISSGGASSSVTQGKIFLFCFVFLDFVLFHLLISFSELQIWNRKMLS